MFNWLFNRNKWKYSTLYKHDNNTDVAFEIIHMTHFENMQIWELEVEWWNIGNCHKPWDMGVSQKITIPDSKRKEWKVYGKN